MSPITGKSWQPPDPVAQYNRARASWLLAIENGRSHAVVNALWETVRLGANRLGIIPGLDIEEGEGR